MAHLDITSQFTPAKSLAKWAYVLYDPQWLFTSTYYYIIELETKPNKATMLSLRNDIGDYIIRHHMMPLMDTAEVDMNNIKPCVGVYLNW